MNNRCWLWLFLTAPLLLSPRMATAQNPKSYSQPPFKQSHHDLPGEFDPANAQELMTQRLQELRDLHQLQDPVQELRWLREKLLKGEELSQDRNWKELLKQAAAWRKLDQRQIDFFHRWAKRGEHNLPDLSKFPDLRPQLHSITPPPLANALGSLAPPPSPPAAGRPGPSLFDRLQEETTKWLMDNLDDVGGNVAEALTDLEGSEANTPLAELLRSVRQPDFSDLHVGEPARELSRYLGNVGDFFREQRGVWDEVHSLFRDASVPSLADFSSPSASVRASPAAEGDDGLPALLSLLMLAALVLLLCKRGLAAKAPADAGEEWRLGPWPLPPDRVSTRQDVIRAFEHLALLRLGPAAAACHHRQLAERLAELPSHPSDSGGMERAAACRQAAETLAWLYEQARYAPADDALSPDQLTDARHALCFLAGVTAP